MDEEFRVSRKLLKTLTVDTRANILKALEERPMTASELSRRLNKHVTTIAEHLQKLRESELVERIERPGRKWVYYRLAKEGRKVLHPESYRWVLIFSVSFLCFISLYAISKAFPEYWSPIGKAFENLQLSLATSNAEKARKHIQYAEERLEEAKIATEKRKLPFAKSRIKEYKEEIEKAKNEIRKARERGENIVPLLETLSESTAKHKAILENILVKTPALKKEVQPVLNISRVTQITAIEELRNITGKPYGKITGG